MDSSYSLISKICCCILDCPATFQFAKEWKVIFEIKDGLVLSYAGNTRHFIKEPSEMSVLLQKNRLITLSHFPSKLGLNSFVNEFLSFYSKCLV